MFCPIKKVKGKYSLSNSILSYSTYSEIVKKLVTKIGLDPKSFGTHSCRSGGATGLASHVNERELLVSGRWADPRSIRRYVELSDEKRFEMNNILQSNIANV